MDVTSIMSKARWTRRDVDLQQIWQRGNDVYRVVAIADSPTVTLENIATGAQENHVIVSPLFGGFDKLVQSS